MVGVLKKRAAADPSLDRFDHSPHQIAVEKKMLSGRAWYTMVVVVVVQHRRREGDAAVLKEAIVAVVLKKEVVVVSL